MMRRILQTPSSSSAFSSLLFSSSPLRYHHVIRSFSSAPSPTVAATLVKKLRDRTSAPMMECRDALSSALTEGKVSGEDAILERAVILLRQKGVANASAKLAGRVGKEGLVMLNIDNQNGLIKTASLLELNTETDFAARSPLLLQVARALSNTLQNANVGALDVNAFASSAIVPVPNRSVDPAIGALKTVGDAINHILATLRESIKFRRGHRMVSDTQSKTPVFVGAYIHKIPKSSTGGNGEENGNVNAEEEDDHFTAGRTSALVSLKIDLGSASPSGDISYALQHLANKLAMQVVACNARYTSIATIPSAVLDQEKSVLMEQAKKQMAERQTKEKKGGPGADKVLEHMMQGRLRKFYEDNVLSEQSFVVWTSVEGHSDEAQKVSDVLKHEAKRLGLKSIAIEELHRYQLGEGIALAENPNAFADEVAEKIAKAQGKK